MTEHKKASWWLVRVIFYPVAWFVMLLASIVYSLMNKTEVGFNLQSDLGLLKHFWFTYEPRQDKNGSG